MEHFSIQDGIDFLESLGYMVDGLGNEEIIQMVESMFGEFDEFLAERNFC